MVNPYEPNLEKSGYYVDDLDALPFGLVAEAMEAELPPLFARLLTFWFRLRAWFGWRSTTHATQWTPRPTWRTDSPPTEFLQHWGRWIESIEESDLERIGWVESETIGDKQEINLWFRSPDGRSFLQLNWTRTNEFQEGTVAMLSYLPNDREIQTICVPGAWHEKLLVEITPPFVESMPIRNTASLQKLRRVHEQRLTDKAVLSFTAPQFQLHGLESSKRYLVFALEKGLLRELSQREVERILA